MQIRKEAIHKIVISPLFILAVFITVLNDHVLKYCDIVPGIITGKISDFTGLFFFPLLIISLCRIKRIQSIIISYVLVAIGFVLIKFSATFSTFLTNAISTIGINWKIWNDKTDVIALLVLPLSFFYLNTFKVKRDYTLNRNYFKLAIVFLALATCVFTSYSDGKPYPKPGNDGLINVISVTQSSIEISWEKAQDQKYEHNGTKEFTQQELLAYTIYYSTSSDIDSFYDTIFVEGSNCVLYDAGNVDISTTVITGLTPATLYYINVIVTDMDCSHSEYKMIEVVTLTK